jgi:hypothetical protein
LKHSWLLAVIVFAGVLVLGNFVLGPLFCRGEFAIPFLDRAAVCAAQTGFTRSASMLFYFTSVGLALVVGIVADKLPRRSAPAVAPAKPEEKTDAPKEAVEPAAVVTPTPSVAAVTEEPKTEAPKVEAATATPDSVPAADPAPAPAPEPAKVDLASVIEAALKSNAPLPPPAPTPAVPKPAPMPSVTPPAPAAEVPKMPPAPVLPPPPKPAPLVKPWRQKSFEGTNDELIARFKELTKEGGVEAIAAAQRNLDESTLAALASGVDPKQHLSQIAHLLLIEDADLKSEVSRGVVVHIAARLKELGVVADLQPGNVSA